MRTAHQNVPAPQANQEAVNKKFVDDSIAAIPTGGGSFVFRPSGVAVDNIYNNFALLYADLISANGQRLIEFDNSLGACVIPAGAYDMTDVTWEGYRPGYGAVAVSLAAGVTITGLRKFRSLSITTANGAGTPFSITTGPQQHIVAYQTDFKIGSGSSPLFVVSGSGDVIFDLYESGFTNATVVDPPFELQGTASAQLYLNAQSYVSPRTIVSSIGSSLQVTIFSSSAGYNEIQPNSLTTNFFLTNRTFARHLPTQVYTSADSPVSADLQQLILIDGSTGPVDIELPSIPNSGDIRGREIIVKEVSGSLTGGITLHDSFNVDTIDGALTFAFTAGKQAVTLVAGTTNWSVVSDNAALSGSDVNHVISGAARSSYDSTTPRIVGAFAFNPANYTVDLTAPVLQFRALAANGAAGLTNSVQLYNLTDAAVVQTLNFTSTSIVKQSVALTIGGGAGQIPNSEKIYEVRIFLGANPGGDPLKTIELYSAHMVATSTL